MMHDALVGSMLRYAMAVLGPRLPSDLRRRIDTRIVDARKMPRVDRTAIIETLHFVGGTNSYKNL